MSTKTKNNSLIDDIAEMTQSAVTGLGVTAMAAAATVGSLPLVSDHQNIKVALPNQPVFAQVNDSENNPVRREREEVAPHFISYSDTQRTPSRTGKV